MSALAIALLAAAAAAAPAREGRVVQASARRAWLDAGARDGLVVGQVLELRRGAAKAGSCTVEAVTDRRASCAGAGLREGDRFPLAAEAAQVERPAALRAVALTLADKAQLGAALAQAAAPPVLFKGVAFQAGLPGAAPRVDVALGHASWLSTDAGPWHQERLDARVNGLPLGGGFSLFADLTALRWSRRTGDVNDQPGATQLHVWELQVTTRTADRAWAGSLGRVLPWMAPGAPRVDGAQAGLRSESGNELGVYGGGVPNPNTLEPDFQSATGGLYWAVRRAGGETLPFLLHQGRLSFVTTPALGQRVEAEGTLQASLWSHTDVAVDLRAGAGGTAGTALEAARVDLTTRPGNVFTFTGGFRWVGLSREEWGAPGGLTGGKSIGADGAASLQLGTSLVLAAGGGWARDPQTGQKRGWVGPDLTWSRLLGGRGALSLGYREELGWTPGRTAWLQALAQLFTRLDLAARLAWSMQERDAFYDHEAGLSLRATARLHERVELRVGLLGRLDPVASATHFTSALSGDVALAGRF